MGSSPVQDKGCQVCHGWRAHIDMGSRREVMAGLCYGAPWSWGQEVAMIVMETHDILWPAKGRVDSILEEEEFGNFQ